MDEDFLFFGLGSIHELGHFGPARSPLAGFKSCSDAAVEAYRPRKPQPERQPIGFHRVNPR